MIHFFDVDVASQYGLLEAILLQNFQFWIEKNKANNVNYFDGEYWTYNSIKAFSTLFPYASKKQIERALNNLREKGLIKVGNFNESKYDRTLWYALTQKGKYISLAGEMEITTEGNRNHPQGTPIPYNNHIINQIENTDILYGQQTKRKRFSPPTVNEVSAYCTERHNNVDREKFVDYYTANGWKVGKNSMKDWKAAVRTWEKNNKGIPASRTKMKEDEEYDEINGHVF